MKKQGFTLIELLAVIVILGTVVTIASPIVISAIKTSKDKAYERQVALIEDAARRWSTDNANDLTNNTQISISTLQNEGYLDNKEKPKNPITKTEMNGCVKITKNITYNQYKFEYKESC